MNHKIIFILFAFVGISSCNNSDNKADAYGNFETNELSVSAETNGKLILFNIEEGQLIKKGQLVAIVDTIQLFLHKKQLESSIKVINKKLPNEAIQLSVYNERIAKLKNEVNRLNNLVAANAAPSKNLDDVKAELEITLKQKNAAASSLSTQTQGMLAEIEPMQYQLMQIKDQLKRSYIHNPIDGVVLTTMVNQDELTMQGRTLYTVAKLNPLVLRAYVSEDMLSLVKLGSTVKIFTDATNGELKESEGTVTWISSEAEFTPKTIQTRDERTTQVYAIKVNVPNDGSLKIGMPAEVKFQTNQDKN